MQELKRQLMDKKLQGLYLLYGDEQYILEQYLNKMIKVIFASGDEEMNMDVFTEGMDIDRVVDAIYTLPFLADKRLVLLKNYGLFRKKNVKSGEKLLDTIKNVPESTILIVQEKEVDKRTKIFKAMKKEGLTVEFNQMSIDDLVKYVARRLSKVDKKLEKKTAIYFIEVVGHNLNIINNEIDKLIDFTGSREVVYIHDIDEVATKSIENRIFDLVESVGTKNKQKALQLFEDLIFLKEPPTRILFMIIRQFRILLQVKLLHEKGVSSSEMAKRVKLPPFVIKKCLQQTKQFNQKKLKNALQDCLKVEIDFKTGKTDIIVGIEMLILKYSK